MIRDFDLALGSQKATIEPDFSELLDKKAIILKCIIKNAAFLDIGEKIKNTGDLSGLFDGKIPPLLNRLANVLFGTIEADLRIFGETLEFRSFKAESGDIEVSASGSVTESGDTKLDLEIFFSPGITATFPEELKSLLKAGEREGASGGETAGWLSYRVKLESGESKPFLKLETDFIKLEFKQIEEH